MTPQTIEKTIPIVNMDCASCAKTIEKELSKLPGISEINVNVLLKKAIVKYDPDHVDIPQIEERIERIGYRIGYKKYEGVLQKILRAFEKTGNGPRSLSEHEFEEYVLRSRHPVIVEFGSASCPSCNALGRVLTDLQGGTYRSRVYFYRMDVTKTKRWKQLEVTALPTIICFREGKEAWRHHGSPDREELVQQIDGSLQ